MFDKTILMNKVLETLRENQFETFVTQGSFDIVAKRENLFLIKSLMNIDALEESHARDMHAVSYFLSGYPFVVSQRNNREHLNDKTIYSRFNLPVLTPHLFKAMIEEDEVIVTHSSKGRYTQEVNTFELKEKRKEMDFTLEELGRRAGISKKAMYEIESKRVNPQQETVHKLEMILGVELATPYEMKQSQAVYLKPKDSFQRNVSVEFSRIGIDNSSVHSTPFEIVGRGSFSLITRLSDTSSADKGGFADIMKLSGVISSRAVLISKRSYKESIEGLPVVSEPELSELDSSKELAKLLDERTY